MNDIVRELTIDVAKENIFSAILAKQYDKNTRYILATITNLGQKINVDRSSTVIINFRRPDKSAQSFRGTVEEDGRVKVPIPYWALELDGTVTTDISMCTPDERLTTLKFIIQVEQATFDGNSPLITTSKIYGVSGIGNENSILTRTNDAIGITLSITDKGNYKECVASDNNFQKFFDFPEHTDDLNNVFLTITPKAFKIDLTSDGEITAISVKEYEQGDENLGFVVHPFFKKYTSENSYSGIVSRDIAKYLSSAYDKVNEEIFEGSVSETNKKNIVVRSVPNVDYTKSNASWDLGREIVKNTNGSYGVMSWLFLDLFRTLCLIYFARTDLNSLFDVEFEYSDSDYGREYESLSHGNLTGATNQIESHTGYNSETHQFKIFNIDDALASITIDGCYQTDDGFYFSYLFDFDASKDTGAHKSTLLTRVTGYNGEYDIITKISYDISEPAFKLATALRPTTEDKPECSMQNIYYSATQKICGLTEHSFRGQLYSFARYNRDIYPDFGVFFSVWLYGFDRCWYNGDGEAVRLCKSPF